MSSANLSICLIIILLLLSSLVIKPQQKSSKDETIFYDIKVEFDGSADCNPCNGPYLTELNTTIWFEKVKFKFADYNDEGGAGFYNWYFSGGKGKQVKGYPMLAMLGEGIISTYALCDHTPKKSDCKELVRCSFSNVETMLKEPVLVPVPKGEVESRDDMFGYWDKIEQDSSGFEIVPLVKPTDECVARIVFGLCAIRSLASLKTKLEWDCEGWKEADRIQEIDFLFALPKGQLLKGEPLQYEFDYEHPDVPGPGRLTIVFFPSD